MMRIFSACKTLILLMFFAIPTQVLKAQCTVGAASSVPIVCPNTAITNITHSTTGATGNGTPTGLPTGVTAAWASNKITISGAPSVAGIYNYSIPLTGGCGSEKATGKIMVKSSPTTTIIGNNTICNPTLNANATSGGGSVGSVITAIAGGGSHSLFLKNDGTVWATGGNNSGQLGDGTTTERISPVKVSGLSGIIAIAGGGYHSLFLKNDGTVWATGGNYYGQLGDGTTTNRTTPIQVSGLSGITAIAGGGSHSLFLKNDGTVWATGYNEYGQLGDGTNTSRKTPVKVSGLSGITAIAGGDDHSLFLKNDGTVWATGRNYYGQLGDGTNLLGADKKTPFQVSGLSGITAIAGGAYHSLFLQHDGTVWATGANWGGQLGDGTNTEKKKPVKVSGLSGITTIAGGYNHSLFLKNDGTVWATGKNDYGQLGVGTNTSRTTPVKVGGLIGITAIAGGGDHSLFLKNDGTVWATGWNVYGQLGDGTTTQRTTPVQVSGLAVTVTSYQWFKNGSAISGATNATYTAATAGSYIVQVTNSNDCSATATAVVVSVNTNTSGAASSSPTVCKNTAITNITHSTTGATGIGTPTGLPAGVTAAWASNKITISGTPMAAGIFNYSIPLTGGCGSVNATGTITVKSSPTTSITGNTSFCAGGSTLLTSNATAGSGGSVKATAAGVDHSLFLLHDGTVWATGDNLYGQLGDGTDTNRTTPVKVRGLSGITAITGGESHSLFLKNDGTAWATGGNYYGQLGDGTTTWRTTPVQVSGLSGITAIAGEVDHSLFLKNDGTVWATGHNEYGQLGDGTDTSRTTPVQVSGLSGITAIAVGESHSLFLKNDGTVWATGWNYYGQLGDGTTTQRTTPVQVSGLSGITAIAGGQYHSLFLKNDGTVWATGYNFNGELGDGSHRDRKTPVKVSGLSGITAIAGGESHSLFLKNDGTVWATGYNGYGQLGDGTNGTVRTTPVPVSGLSGITAIAGGAYHSLFFKNDGTVWATGYNYKGQLGDGTTIDKNTPVKVSGLVVTITSYQWFKNGSAISGATNATYTADTAGSYTVQVANSNGCSATSSAAFVVTVKTNTAGKGSSAPAVCTNTALTAITHNTTGATGIANDGVSGANGLPAGVLATWASNTITISGTPTVLGTYNYSIPLTGGCGAVNATGKITVVSLAYTPTITTVGSTFLCFGDSVTLSSATTGNQWYVNGSPISGAINQTYVAKTNGTYTLIVTTSCGTSSPSSGTIVKVNDLPTATITATGSLTFCSGDSVLLRVPNGNNQTYQWQKSDTDIPGATDTLYIVKATGSYKVKVVNTVSGCTKTSLSTNITVYALPTVGAITGNKILCKGSTSQLSDTTVGGTWSSSDTLKAKVSSTGLVSGIAPGTVIITYTTPPNTGGCVSKTTATVSIKGLPSIGSITGTRTVCANKTTQLSNSFAGGVWSSSNTTKATISSTGLVSGVASGTTTITYTLTNSDGCISTATAVVTLSALPTVGAITGNTTLCRNSTTQLSNTTAGGTWSSGDTLKAKVSSTGLVSGIAPGTVVITYTTVPNTKGCVNIAKATVSVKGLPSIGSINGTKTVCANNTTQLNNSFAGGVWSSSNTTKATISSTGLVLGIAAGTTTITYTLTNSDGCISTATALVTISSLPTVAPITGTLSVCKGKTTKLSNTTAGGKWSSSDTLKAKVSSTGLVSGIAPGTVIITYTTPPNTGGCVNIAKATVSVKGLPSIGSITGTKTVCANKKTQLSNSFAGGVWSSSNTTKATISSTGLVTGVASGTTTITYTLTNSDGCISTATAVVTVTAPCLMKEELAKETKEVTEIQPYTLQVSIFPNPTGNVFNVRVKASKQESINIRVLDVNGRTAFMSKGMPGQVFHFGEQLKAGTYMVEVRQGEEVKTVKAVKVRQ